MTETSDKRNFGILDDLRYARIGSARLSPCGGLAVCDLTRHDLENNLTTTSLWRIDLETGGARQLTQGNSSNTSPSWSPDGEQIAFLSDRSGVKQVFLLPLSGGEAQQFTDLPQGVDGPPLWSPDGGSIAFTASSRLEPRDPTAPYRVTRFIYRFDGIGYLEDAVQNIFVQSTHGGGATQLTDDAHLDRTLRWSPDGRELLYLASFDPDRSDLFSAKLRAVNLAGDVEDILGLDWGFIKNAGWLPDGDRIMVVASRSDQPMATKDDLWIVDRATGRAENRTADLPTGIEIQWFPVFSAANIPTAASAASVNVVERGTKGIYTVAISGAPQSRPVLGGNRTISLQDADAEIMLYLSGDLENPGELCIASLDGSNERRVTGFNDDLCEQIDFARVEELQYKTKDGAWIQGWLLLPTQGKPPYPAILYIHGGPHGWYGYQYGSDFQMLAGAGYAVLFVNPRGSTGYGDEFATALSGNWGVLDHKDLLEGVDHAIDAGFADPDRLGICGLSYGGFLTCYTIGQTNRFKAAVAENPITDLVSRYGTADMGPWGSLSELGGKPHEIEEVYRRGSPITFAHNCRTPTLLIQCEEDYRCPAGQAEQFFGHLKANGCIVEMLRIPGVSHVASITGPIRVQKAQNEALLDWMQRYV
ncbi:MAG: S9 family peptidase [Chloroflexi bacterium]|nr:S9 family peptidase [Chloroflexota bacterium]